MRLMDLLRFSRVRLNLDLILGDFNEKVEDWLSIGSFESDENEEQFLAKNPSKIRALKWF